MSWEQWRFDALVEAAKETVWGRAWEKAPGYGAYLQLRSVGVPWYRVPSYV